MGHLQKMGLLGLHHVSANPVAACIATYEMFEYFKRFTMILDPMTVGWGF